MREGENRIVVKVVNTLANPMSSYSTSFLYDGQMVSGNTGSSQDRVPVQGRLEGRSAAGIGETGLLPSSVKCCLTIWTSETFC